MKADRQNDDHMQTNPANVKFKLLHWILLILYVVFYIIFNVIIVYLSRLTGHFELFGINKYTLNGVLAQGQVIAIILITLNPVECSHHIALILCCITGVASLVSLLTSGNPDALPGVLIPITSGAVIIIIHNYANSLKSQLNKVIEYGRIVKNNEQMLHRLAYYDALTGLANRKMLMDRIDMLTKQGKLGGNSFILVYLDIDDFKNINDTMGHSVGDAILKCVAERWEQHCHDKDMLARFSGDEFVILICHKTNPKELAEYLDGFRNALKEPVSIGYKDFHINSSAGITRFPEDANNAEELLKNADIALYKAKRRGKDGYLFFNRAMHDEVTRRIRLAEELLSAIGNNELYMVYQPQFISDTNRLRGFEALARWKHPQLGMISPIEFIPIAEEAGIIIELGKWIIETVLNAFNALKKNWDINTVVSINISVKQILGPSFINMVSQILDKTGFNSANLELEITESVFISNPEYVIDVINRLKGLGISIALDDFGTKYASLNHLQMLPINILKIDKTFIDRINPYDPANQMTGAIISLSHRLGIKVVAEGVERKEQLHYLVEQDCDYIQGYLLSKPVDEQQLIKLFAEIPV